MVKLTRETNTMTVVGVVESDWREVYLIKDKKKVAEKEGSTRERHMSGWIRI